MSLNGTPDLNKMPLSEAIHFLNQFEHPALICEWACQPGFVQDIDGQICVIFPFAAAELVEALKVWLERQKKEGERGADFRVTQKVVSLKAGDKPLLSGVKNLLVVSSGKGGVGKSTTAVNLALGLQAQGAKVGILDADIYGPSLPLMLGTKGQKITTLDGKTMEPIKAHGLFSNSIGYLMPDDDAMVWRGPMASKAFSQLLNETHWPDIDYLVLDMPPGTGDIQLSLAQQFPVTGAMVVTTPQDLALLDVMRGIVMFEQVGVPVLGLVENMSFHICSECGHHEAIFGKGGAAKMAAEQGLSLLGQVPLDRIIREDLDAGVPTLVAKPDSEHSAIYRQMALNVASRLYWQGERMPEKIEVFVSH